MMQLKNCSFAFVLTNLFVMLLQVDAIDYYKYEEDVLRAECESQKVTAYRDPAGIAFVTFESDYMAEK